MLLDARNRFADNVLFAGFWAFDLHVDDGKRVRNLQKLVQGGDFRSRKSRGEIGAEIKFFELFQRIIGDVALAIGGFIDCVVVACRLYTSPSPRDKA